MDVIEAIKTRRSIRAYRPDPVPKEVLYEILEAARWAPSWENTQPWEFAVVGGQAMEELKRALLEAAESGDGPGPELPPPRFPEPYNSRRRSLGMTVLQTKNISREDVEKRQWWHLLNTRFFEAPSGIIVYIDKALNIWSVFDCASVATSIMLAAQKYGLGTCPQVAPLRFPDVVKKVLEIPDSKLLVLAIAIGYPDWSDPINQFPREREPVESLTRWYGFE